MYIWLRVMVGVTGSRYSMLMAVNGGRYSMLLLLTGHSKMTNGTASMTSMSTR